MMESNLAAVSSLIATLHPLSTLTDNILTELSLQFVVLVSNLILIYKLLIPKDCKIYRKTLFRGVSSMITVTSSFSLLSLFFSLYESKFQNQNLNNFIKISTNGALLSFYVTLPCMFYHMQFQVKNAVLNSLPSLTSPRQLSDNSSFGQLARLKIYWPYRPLHIHLMLLSGVIYSIFNFYKMDKTGLRADISSQVR